MTTAITAENRVKGLKTVVFGTLGVRRYRLMNR